MKKTIVVGIVVLTVGVLVPRIVPAQGMITYLSNLNQTSTGSSAVGSNSWFATDFITGTNSGGYFLNSVQLAMTSASGNPSGFTAMIYTDVGIIGPLPGSSLGTLVGSADPATAGTYTYTASSDLTLSPNTSYFLVLTSGTAVANGAFEWSDTGTPSPGYNSYHWGGEISLLDSSNGQNWNTVNSDIYGQYALDATAAPEPSSEILLGLSGLAFLWRRWRAKQL